MLERQAPSAFEDAKAFTGPDPEIKNHISTTECHEITNMHASERLRGEKLGRIGREAKRSIKYSLIFFSLG
jgi:hypothetical protein